MSQTGYVYDPLYLDHYTSFHPECPERLEKIMSKLNAARILDYIQSIPPRPATVEEVAMVHSPAHIEGIRQICLNGGGNLDPDTYTSERSYDAAMLAAGGLLCAVDKVMEGKFRNTFALVRPPGHHAMPERAMGFCLFNNVAIAARYLEKAYGLERILIVDWDVHHGNGTEFIFYNTKKVLYFSIHQGWIFPGTGWTKDVGKGEGEGFTINVPLEARMGDAEYETVFQEILYPAALQYKPQFVLISAGQDSHHSDPIGAMRLTSLGFENLTKIVMNIADKCCDGRITATLEGGYNLEGQALSVAAIFNALSGLNFNVHEDTGVKRTATVSPMFMNDVNEVKKIHGKYWNFDMNRGMC